MPILGYIKAAPWALCGILLLALSAQTVRLSNAKAETEKERASHATTQKNYAEAVANALEARRKFEIELQEKVNEAVRKAQKQAEQDRAAAAAARADADSLRQQLSEARNALANAPSAAIIDYAVTVSELFDNCVREYQSMAEKAQGHASDVKTLIDAWPDGKGQKGMSESISSNPEPPVLF